MEVQDEFLKAAQGVVRSLMPRIVAAWSSPAKNAETKLDGSLVTDTDKYVEAQATEALTSALPNVVVVGEESISSLLNLTSVASPSYYTKCLHHEYCVFLDPIDGTKNFAHGSPHFCVSIGLTRRDGVGHIPVAGVVAVPVEGVMYSTDGVVVEQEMLTTGAKSVIASRKGGAQAIFANSTERAWLEKNRLKLDGEWFSHGSSVYDLLRTCLGDARAALVGSQRMWDVAAPLVLAKALGLSVLDVATGKPITALEASDFDQDLERKAWRLTRRMLILPQAEGLNQILLPL